jgi:hypothetical protein
VLPAEVQPTDRFSTLQFLEKDFPGKRKLSTHGSSTPGASAQDKQPRGPQSKNCLSCISVSSCITVK